MILERFIMSIFGPNLQLVVEDKQLEKLRQEITENIIKNGINFCKNFKQVINDNDKKENSIITQFLQDFFLLASPYYSVKKDIEILQRVITRKTEIKYILDEQTRQTIALICKQKADLGMR